jgi:hypothetical protein
MHIVGVPDCENSAEFYPVMIIYHDFYEIKILINKFCLQEIWGGKFRGIFERKVNLC